MVGLSSVQFDLLGSLNRLRFVDAAPQEAKEEKRICLVKVLIEAV